MPLIKNASFHKAESKLPMIEGSCWFAPIPLQAYVLLCCQPALRRWDSENRILSVSPEGGLCDKPGCAPDYYHTCYALSGLSIVAVRYTHTQ